MGRGWLQQGQGALQTHQGPRISMVICLLPSTPATPSQCPSFLSCPSSQSPCVLAPFLKDLNIYLTHLHTFYSEPASSSQILTANKPVIILISQKRTLAQRGEVTHPGSPASKWPRQNSKPGCVYSALSLLPLRSPGKLVIFRVFLPSSSDI